MHDGERGNDDLGLSRTNTHSFNSIIQLLIELKARATHMKFIRRINCGGCSYTLIYRPHGGILTRCRFKYVDSNSYIYYCLHHSKGYSISMTIFPGTTTLSTCRSPSFSMCTCTMQRLSTTPNTHKEIGPIMILRIVYPKRLRQQVIHTSSSTKKPNDH